MIILSDGHDRRCPGAVFGNLIEHFEVKKINSLAENRMSEIIRLSSDHISKVNHNCAVWTLKWKVQIVNNLLPDFVIETHLNSYSNPKAHGCEVLYYPSGNNKVLAEIIQQSMLEKTQNTDRGIKIRKDLYFLKKTSCPAFIVEPLFLSNEEDRELLKKTNLIADGLILGIQRLKDRLTNKK